MDVKISQVNGKTALEYNAIGGIFDFHFLSDSKKDPSKVSRPYAKVAGLSVEVQYWSFGFHQCRYGYHIADVVPKSGWEIDALWIDMNEAASFRSYRRIGTSVEMIWRFCTKK